MIKLSAKDWDDSFVDTDCWDKYEPFGHSDNGDGSK